MSALLKVIRSETVLILGLVQSVIAMVGSFGLRLSGDQLGTVMAVVAALLGLVARTQVTPTTPPTPVPPSPPPA